MKDHFLAITIGPIYDTLRQARKTRELWGASYLFSVLMREIIKALPTQWELLAPVMDTGKAQNGAGIYPDRCFIRTPAKPTKGEVDAIIDSAMASVGSLLGVPGNQVRGYFRVFAARMEADSSDKESLILHLNRLLDSLELQPFIPPNNAPALTELIDLAIKELQDDGGGNDAFVQFSGQRRLPSLNEVAFQELKDLEAYKKHIEEPTNESVLKYQRDKKERKPKTPQERKQEALDEDSRIQAFKNSNDVPFKFRHKYVCFVKADGDNVGKTIGAIGNHFHLVKEFSKELGNFSQKAVNAIAQFGGLPIYAGGDDLLFIAPVQNKEKKHVFELIQDLDLLFPGATLQELGKQADPSFGSLPALSYGMSVSYFKYPMFESLDAMNDLLFVDAKGFDGKNALAFRVLKHSGQAFGVTFGKGGEIFRILLSLIKLCRSQEASFLTSVMHRLQALQPLLEEAVDSKTTTYFFKYHFNEPAHARSDTDRYLSEVRKLAEAVSKEGLPVAKTLFPLLRFLQFLNQDDHE